MTYQFERKVDSILKKYKLTKESSIVVAFSGGADSLSLLISLSHLFYKNVKPVYVNHNLRSDRELQKEILLNKKNAEKLGYNLIVHTIQRGIIEKGARKNASGIEGEARNLRLSILENEALSYNNAYILTGHNRDDATEWEIISFFRGRLSLSSIQEKRDKYIRPLLGMSHSTTVEYCKKNDFEFSADSTNEENEHLRNKVRNILIPTIESIFPSFDKTFLERRILENYSGEPCINVYKETYFCIPSVIIKLSEFNDHSSEKKASSILKAFSFFEKSTNGGRISLSSVNDIFTLINENKSTVLLKYGVYVFTTSYNLSEKCLVFMRKGEIDAKIENRDKNMKYAEPGIIVKTKSGKKSALKILKDKKIPSVLRPLITIDSIS